MGYIWDMFVIGREYSLDATADHYNMIENCELARGGHSVMTVGSAKYNMIRNNYLHNEEWINVGGTDTVIG